MKKRIILLFFASLVLSGCWVARTTRDRPELQSEVGKSVQLADPCVIFRDRGGRLHLTDNEARDLLRDSSVVARLPAGTSLTIKDVIHRISEPGRHDYYVTEIHGNQGMWTIEVPVEEKLKPRWK
jgi:hypothetical protein